MKRKLLYALLIVLMAALCALGLAACDFGSGTETHKHTFSTEWSSDETYHWHAATCEHTDEVEGKDYHVFEDNICIECGYEPAEELEYTLSDDGTYYLVTGTGTWLDNNVVIPEEHNSLPVKSIAEGAFSNSTFTSIVIPDSVTTIEDRAFEYCTLLENVTIPDSVTTIGNYAFSNCNSLKSITIPDSVTSIVYSTFLSCSTLEKVTIGNGVTSIGNSAFSGCTALESVTIPAGAMSIGNSAFYNCSALKNVIIPESVTSIGTSAFYGCTAIENVTLPTSAIDSLPKSNLKTVVITSGDSIENFTFRGCLTLESISIPDSVTSIEDYAFASCTALKAIYYGGTESAWANMNIDLFGNTALTEATRYYYSETQPTEDGNFWHYGTDGVTPVVWTKETV